MRKISVLLLLLVLASALVLSVAGCGEQPAPTGAPANGTPTTAAVAGATQTTAAPAGASTPQDVLASAMKAAQNLKSATGSIDVAIKLDVDTSKVPEQEKAFVTNPITLTGTFSESESPQAVEADLSLGLAGQATKFALKSADTNTWVQLNNQWYETPPELKAATQSVDAEANVADMMKLLSDLKIDPVTWMKDLTLVGEETVDNTATYHVKGTPDVTKMIADVTTLMQSPEFQKMVGSATAQATGTSDSTGTSGATGGANLGSMMPSADSLQQMAGQFTDLFKNFTVEMWIGKADSLPRKLSVTIHITPPVGQDSQGVNAIDVTANIALQNLNQAVTIQAPQSPLPYADLEKAMQENPEQLLGPIGTFIGALGAGIGGAGTDISVPGSTDSTVQ